jgi:CubicO group peptidase (beta-lactamase class C family)
MRPRDQLKLGQLYLDGGVWRGRQVLPSAWVEESLLSRSSFGPDHGYGYTWHVIDLESGGEEYRIFEAGGNGGQFVLFIPQLDVAIGITAGNYGDYGTWYRFLTALVPRYLIPAARSVP